MRIINSIPFSADKIDKSFNMALTSQKHYGVIPVIPALMGQIYWRCMRMSATNPKYVGSYTSDGLLNIVYQVHEVIGDVYVLESIFYFDLIYFISNGSEPSEEPVVEQICEKKLSDIENPRLFYSWLGIASEFVRSEEIRDKQERYQEA